MRKSFVARMKCNEIQEKALKVPGFHFVSSGLRPLVLKVFWLNEDYDNEALIVILFQS